MKLLAPLKKFILFPRRGYGFLAETQDWWRFFYFICFQFASLPSSPTPRYRNSPHHFCFSIFLPPLASYRGGNRLMYLQEPIPIVIPGYDLRLRRFDCQISSSFASPTRWNVAARRETASDNPQVALLRRVFISCWKHLSVKWMKFVLKINPVFGRSLRGFQFTCVLNRYHFIYTILYIKVRDVFFFFLGLISFFCIIRWNAIWVCNRVEYKSEFTKVHIRGGIRMFSF